MQVQCIRLNDMMTEKNEEGMLKEMGKSKTLKERRTARNEEEGLREGGPS